MSKIKHILAATDLSEEASLAINRGFVLAKAIGAHLTVAHAVGVDALSPFREWLGDNIDTLHQSIVDDASQQLNALVAQSPLKGDCSLSICIERGYARTVIPAYAETHDVDIIVLGAHGAGFIQRMLMGSTASQLLRKSKCPVLIVKQASPSNYKRLLVAVDFSPGSATVIKIAQQIAPHADIVLLHSFEAPFEGKMHYAGVSQDTINRYRDEARARCQLQLRELAEKAGLGPHQYASFVASGDSTQNILDYEEQYQCDLIVMGKHGTHVTEELLLGSVTKRILASSKSDVLVSVDKRPPENLLMTP